MNDLPGHAARPPIARIVACLALAVAAAGVTIPASAQEHRGPAGFGRPGGGMMMFGGSPEHMARGIDRMLDGLNASDAPRQQIKQIATAAATDLQGQREAGRGQRDRALQIFAAPNVDAGAAESLQYPSSSSKPQ